MTTLKLSKLHDQLVAKDVESFLTQDNLDFLMNNSTARRLAKVYNFVNTLPYTDQDMEGGGCPYYNDLIDYIQECLAEGSSKYEEITFPESEDDDLDYYQTPEHRVSFVFVTLLSEAVEKPHTTVTQNLTPIPPPPKPSRSASSVRRPLWT